MFTDDCVIYEPFSRRCTLYNNDGAEKSCLKGRTEIESFFNLVMMATDGLQYEIKFIDEPIDRDYGQPNEVFDLASSSTIISVLATFYRMEGEDELKERLTFHVISDKDHDNANTTDSNSNNNRKIKTLWVQFCSPLSTS